MGGIVLLFVLLFTRRVASRTRDVRTRLGLGTSTEPLNRLNFNQNLFIEAKLP